jgi:hypothetical protein
MPFFDVTVSVVLRVDTEDKDIAERMGLDYLTGYMLREDETPDGGNYKKNFPEEPLPQIVQTPMPVAKETDPEQIYPNPLG